MKESVRWDSRGLNIKADQHDPFEAQAHFTDPQFFDFFNFPLVKGTIRLEDRATVVITEKCGKEILRGQRSHWENADFLFGRTLPETA